MFYTLPPPGLTSVPPDMLAYQRMMMMSLPPVALDLSLPKKEKLDYHYNPQFDAKVFDIYHRRLMDKNRLLMSRPRPHRPEPLKLSPYIDHRLSGHLLLHHPHQQHQQHLHHYHPFPSPITPDSPSSPRTPKSPSSPRSLSGSSNHNNNNNNNNATFKKQMLKRYCKFVQPFFHLAIVSYSHGLVPLRVSC